MCDDSVHSGLTTASQFVPSIFLSVGLRQQSILSNIALILDDTLVIGHQTLPKGRSEPPKDFIEWSTVLSNIILLARKINFRF